MHMHSVAKYMWTIKTQGGDVSAMAGKLSFKKTHLIERIQLMSKGSKLKAGYYSA